MKFTTQPLIVDDTDSFQNDLLGRENFGKALLNLLLKTDDSLVIALNAPWGEGKTTFVKMWQGLLREHKILSIYFDAFENDYFNEPFLALVGEINSFIESLPKGHPAKRKGKEFKERAVKAGTQLLSVGTKAAIKVATAGLIKEAEIESFQDVIKEISQDQAEILSQYIKTKLNHYQKDKETIRSFREKFQELALDVKTDSHSPLVIIIDELDRCKPLYALELIEKVKHLFSVDNTVFLLVMHKEQLEEMVRSVYGAKIDAAAYLQKFIHIECRLPKNKTDKVQNDYHNYCKALTDRHDLTTWEHKDRFQEVITSFAHYFDLSLRDLERCYTNLVIFYDSLAERSLTIAVLLGFLAVIKVRFPSVYYGLKERTLSVDEIFAELKLNKAEPSLQHFIAWLNYCLLSDEEFAKLDAHDKVRSLSSSLAQYSIERKDIIPYLCENMDLFGLSA